MGILYLSVIADVTKRNVCAWTKVLGKRSVSIAGMRQATHWLPALPVAWCVCSSIVAVPGPLPDMGAWQSRQSLSAGLRSNSRYCARHDSSSR